MILDSGLLFWATLYVAIHDIVVVHKAKQSIAKTAGTLSKSEPWHLHLYSDYIMALNPTPNRAQQYRKKYRDL